MTDQRQQWIDEAITLLERCKTLLKQYYGQSVGSHTVMEIEELVQAGQSAAELVKAADAILEEDIFE